jgi:5-methylcytosine-specific restriction enzyme B
MIQAFEFIEWLKARGCAEKASKTRFDSLQKLEQTLNELGCSQKTLKDAYEADKFTFLRQQISNLIADSKRGGTAYKVLMPLSEKPNARLANIGSYLTHYGNFLEDPQAMPLQADRIREYAFTNYIEPAFLRADTSVDIPVRDIHDSLRLSNAFPAVCSAIGSKALQELAGVPPPSSTSPNPSSTTVFTFSLFNGASSMINELNTHPLNLILHGPPGTGKTYATAKYAVEMCGEVAPEDRLELMAAYDRLNEAGRIAFVTFHQSFAYEDFVEGLRPEPIEGGSGFELVPRDGVLKRVAAKAAAQASRNVDNDYDIACRQIFKMSLGAVDGEDSYIFDECIRDNCVMLGWGGDVDWSGAQYTTIPAFLETWKTKEPDATTANANIRQPFTLRTWMKDGDLVVISEGNLKFRAIGEVIGPYEFVKRDSDDYHHRRDVRWLWVAEKAEPYSLLLESKKFSQVSLYNMVDQGLDGRMNNKAGVKLAALQDLLAPIQSMTDGPLPHVLIIDEINRANVSKTFGELITLLEDDKRLGAENQLKVTLPYTGESFGLPQNLHVLGTMNTADRSIALLDTALRRRFAFEELMPDPAVLTAVIGGIPASAILRGLNERVEWLYDRDHLIGHAWLIGADTDEDLSARFKTKIIPLLQEYFHEDWDRVRAALGEVEGQALFVKKIVLAAPAGFEGAQERYRYQVLPGPYCAAAWTQVAGKHLP